MSCNCKCKCNCPDIWEQLFGPPGPPMTGKDFLAVAGWTLLFLAILIGLPILLIELGLTPY